MVQETVNKLKKNDKVYVVYGIYQDSMRGYVQEVNEENLILLDYVPDVLVEIPIKDIHEVAVEYKAIDLAIKKVGDLMGLRVRLKELLKEKGITQKQLAEMAGLTEAQVSIIAANRTQTINRDHLFKIAVALNEREYDKFFEWIDETHFKK